MGKGGPTSKAPIRRSSYRTVTSTRGNDSTIVLKIGQRDDMNSLVNNIKMHRKQHRSWGVVSAVNYIGKMGMIIMGLNCGIGSDEYDRMIQNLRHDMPSTVEIMTAIDR
jgi:hypothetical protein